MADRAQCVRSGPLSSEYPERLTTGNKAGRCWADAAFSVQQGDEEPDAVYYGHLAQSIAARSPRQPVMVRHLPRVVVTSDDACATSAGGPVLGAAGHAWAW